MSEIYVVIPSDGKIEESTENVYQLLIPKDTNFEGFLEILYHFFALNSDEYLKVKFQPNPEAETLSNDDQVRFFMSKAEMEKNRIFYHLCVNIECQNVNTGNDEEITIELGKAFSDMEILYFILSMTAIRGKFQFIAETWTEELLVVRCLVNNCKWRVHASKSGQDLFRVVEYEDVHTCSRKAIKGEHRQATCWFVERYILFLSMYDVPGLVYNPYEIIEYMQSKLGIGISYGKACEARQNVLDLFKKSPEVLYSWLPSYCALLQSKNPGSVIHIETNNEDRFKYLFMALYASIQGWLACRPVIGINATSMEAYGDMKLRPTSSETPNPN